MKHQTTNQLLIDRVRDCSALLVSCNLVQPFVCYLERICALPIIPGGDHEGDLLSKAPWWIHSFGKTSIYTRIGRFPQLKKEQCPEYESKLHPVAILQFWLFVWSHPFIVITSRSTLTRRDWNYKSDLFEIRKCLSVYLVSLLKADLDTVSF